MYGHTHRDLEILSRNILDIILCYFCISMRVQEPQNLWRG